MDQILYGEELIDRVKETKIKFFACSLYSGETHFPHAPKLLAIEVFFYQNYAVEDSWGGSLNFFATAYIRYSWDKTQIIYHYCATWSEAIPQTVTVAPRTVEDKYTL